MNSVEYVVVQSEPMNFPLSVSSSKEMRDHTRHGKNLISNLGGNQSLVRSIIQLNGSVVQKFEPVYAGSVNELSFSLLRKRGRKNEHLILISRPNFKPW